jgi:hypothetical protein
LIFLSPLERLPRKPQVWHGNYLVARDKNFERIQELKKEIIEF